MGMRQAMSTTEKEPKDQLCEKHGCARNCAIRAKDVTTMSNKENLSFGRNLGIQVQVGFSLDFSYKRKYKRAIEEEIEWIRYQKYK